jgi:hypothetical protein
MVFLPEASITVYALPTTPTAFRELLVLVIPGGEDWLGKRLVWNELTPVKPIRVGCAEVSPFSVDHRGLTKKES